MKLELNSPITEEQWDMIMDVNMEHANSVTFKTKNGSEVTFYKAVNDGDAISRKAAIDAIRELAKWYYATFHEKRPTVDAIINKLMDLPPAQPERKRREERKLGCYGRNSI